MNKLNENNPSAEKNTTQKKKKDWGKEFKHLILIIIAVAGFRSMFFEPFRIPTGSMIPSIMIGDFILVNKLSYGIKVPFTEYMKEQKYFFKYDKPKHGDIIVFKYPLNESISYIKRVIAIPGDTVEIINKDVYVNGNKLFQKELEKSKQAEITKQIENNFTRFNLKVSESVTGDKIHNIIHNKDNYGSKQTTMKKIKIPKDHYFVMGDNRDFSADSRYWGLVPFNNIKGKAKFVWFSMRIPLFGDTGGGVKLKPERIGTSL